MFYCNLCRVLNGWQSGITTSYGMCEVCEKKRPCWDTPSSVLRVQPGPRRIELRAARTKSVAELVDQKTLVVVEAVRNKDTAIVTVRQNDPSDPKADPLIIGIIPSIRADSQVLILWDNQIWRPTD